MLSYSSLEINRAYQLHEILDFNDARNSEYIDYLKENDLTHTVVMRVMVPKGERAGYRLAVPRSASQPAPANS